MRQYGIYEQRSKVKNGTDFNFLTHSVGNFFSVVVLILSNHLIMHCSIYHRFNDLTNLHLLDRLYFIATVQSSLSASVFSFELLHKLLWRWTQINLKPQIFTFLNQITLKYDFLMCFIVGSWIICSKTNIIARISI